MNCEKWKNRIILHLYGELQEKEERELAAHARSCPSCERELAEDKETRALLSSLSDRERPSAIVEQTILLKAKTRNTVSFWPLARLALASILLVAIGLITLHIAGPQRISQTPAAVTWEEPGLADMDKLRNQISRLASPENEPLTEVNSSFYRDSYQLEKKMRSLSQDLETF